MNKRLEWHVYGTCTIGQNNPPIEYHECEIGTDSDGFVWRARSRYIPDERRFMVWFDKDEWHETEGGKQSSPFLRPEVIDAKDYWKAHKEWHDHSYCDYNEIAQTVFNHMAEYGIE